LAEQGKKRDRRRRVFVKKVAMDPEGETPSSKGPSKDPKARRKVVAKVPVKETSKVRRVIPTPIDPKAPPVQNAGSPPKVKRTVVPRPAETGVDAPKQVERVVVRQKPKDSAPPTPDQLESGYNYLIEEPQPKRSFEFFKAKVGKGAKGLCISTSYPKKIIEEYGLHGTTVYWLSELEFDNQSLHPRRLDFEVTRAIQNFVKSNPSSVLIIDGVEFLILINGFERVMTFIKKMNDIMSATASTLITSINPSAFSEEKLSIIEREFDRVYKFLG
jgi:hypothetical protein